jgi:hypothetical protein
MVEENENCRVDNDIIEVAIEVIRDMVDINHDEALSLLMSEKMRDDSKLINKHFCFEIFVKLLKNNQKTT